MFINNSQVKPFVNYFNTLGNENIFVLPFLDTSIKNEKSFATISLQRRPSYIWLRLNYFGFVPQTFQTKWHLDTHLLSLKCQNVDASNAQLNSYGNIFFEKLTKRWCCLYNVFSGRFLISICASLFLSSNFYVYSISYHWITYGGH